MLKPHILCYLVHYCNTYNNKILYMIVPLYNPLQSVVK